MIIANWKMKKPFDQSIGWCKKNKTELIDLQKKIHAPIIICPSFDSLDSISKIFKETKIKIGAQNCASKELGALTGEVSSLSLKQIGCNYAIIGHSERRQIFHETNSIISEKLKLLFKNNIIPILCIGETEKEHQEQLTFDILENQLNILESNLNEEIIIAYEPVWAIGSGKIPTTQELHKIISWINKYLSKTQFKFKILYGGSANEKNIEKFLTIPNLSGFLLGSASLEFESLKKIILKMHESIKYNQ